MYDGGENWVKVANCNVRQHGEISRDGMKGAAIRDQWPILVSVFPVLDLGECFWPVAWNLQPLAGTNYWIRCCTAVYPSAAGHHFVWSNAKCSAWFSLFIFSSFVQKFCTRVPRIQVNPFGLLFCQKNSNKSVRHGFSELMMPVLCGWTVLVCFAVLLNFAVGKSLTLMYEY